MRDRPDLPAEERCGHRHCMRQAWRDQRCRAHIGILTRQRRQELWDQLYNPALGRMITNPHAWRDIVAEWEAMVGQPFIDRNFVEHLIINFSRQMRIPELWNRFMGNFAPMEPNGDIAWMVYREEYEDTRPRLPPARGELEAFTRDGQNVHTRFVTEQTNSALSILLNAEVPPEQNTLKESHMCFMEHVALDRIITEIEMIAAVDRDAKRWYRVKTCRQQDDYLYKRTLDGLWAKIKTSTYRRELEIRLWQEMVDSVGMCCDGHITRLANVLCGFDDAFTPELSPAEQLQNRMAVIAGMDTGIILQAAEAMKALTEFNVPREQWEPWIDAL